MEKANRKVSLMSFDHLYVSLWALFLKPGKIGQGLEQE
jgi:hypothetical protein